jgi:thiol-disulfide isomerase/thioredoxin
MTVIAEKDRPAVRDVLARDLVSDVELVLFTQGRAHIRGDDASDGVSCRETRELLDELVNLSDRIHLTIYDVDLEPATATRYNVRAVPTVIIRKHASPSQMSVPAGSLTAGGDGTDSSLATLLSPDLPLTAADAPETDANVRFIGTPSGFEFSTLIADIVDVSRGQLPLSEETVEAIRAIATPVHLQVFVTPACPYCPQAARIAHQMAMTNPLVLAEVIEANEFPALSERYRVRTVPKTIINDRIEFVGPLSEAKVLAAVQEAVRRRDE